MRVVIEEVIPGMDRMLGYEPRRVLKFSKAEKAVLRKAAAIADQARELWRTSVDYELDDTLLPGIEIAVDEYADGITI